MAEQAAISEVAPEAVPQPELPPELAPLGLFERARTWFLEEGPWWLCSFVFHLVLICSLALIGGKAVQKMIGDEPPAFDEAKLDQSSDALKEIERFDLGETPEDPSKSRLDTESLTLEKPGQVAQEERNYDDNPVFSEEGGGVASNSKEQNLGGLGMDIRGVGPGAAIRGKGGVGVGVGTGVHAGTGGEGSGFGGRGTGHRKAMLASGGGTIQSERAVAGALNWLARHQSANGSWGLMSYKARCKDGTCTGPGGAGDRLAAATALGLLPFLAAGQTHKSKGPYQKQIAAGVRFLVSHQKPDGDLRIGLGAQMYDHGLAAIALCECYGMSNDGALRPHAQAALNFIVDAQDPKGGGWRYGPRQEGDTSVVGWQVMALKSGRMAYLPVNPAVFEKTKAFLKSVSFGGQYGGCFSYMPGRQTVGGDDRATTAIGLLCEQYMDMPRTDPVMVEGTAFLMQNLPDVEQHNLYYWYYATQVMNNQRGKDWDVWNRKMRRLLINTQSKDGCATGSWNCTDGKDPWAAHGGRLMMTSLAALTLEIYYRYLPLYKTEKEPGGGNPPAGAAKPPNTEEPPETDEP